MTKLFILSTIVLTRVVISVKLNYPFCLKPLGAQAKNGCLFITIPEHPKFGSLSDRDAERVFKYLVGMAGYDGDDDDDDNFIDVSRNFSLHANC